MICHFKGIKACFCDWHLTDFIKVGFLWKVVSIILFNVELPLCILYVLTVSMHIFSLSIFSNSKSGSSIKERHAEASRNYMNFVCKFNVCNTLYNICL